MEAKNVHYSRCKIDQNDTKRKQICTFRVHQGGEFGTETGGNWTTWNKMIQNCRNYTKVMKTREHGENGRKFVYRDHVTPLRFAKIVQNYAEWYPLLPFFRRSPPPLLPPTLPPLSFSPTRLLLPSVLTRATMKARIKARWLSCPLIFSEKAEIEREQTHS